MTEREVVGNGFLLARRRLVTVWIVGRSSPSAVGTLVPLAGLDDPVGCPPVSTFLKVT
jgi:hypothetical protein